MGVGVEQDKAHAVELYQVGADVGYPPAACNLGFCYYMGIGVDEDN